MNDAEKKPELQDKLREFLVMRNLYEAAARQLTLKFEILNDEFSVLYARNPIHHIESRVKTPESIAAKLMKKGLPVSIETAREHVNDISEPNCANAASSLYCANSTRIGAAIFFIALICAEPPTRDTERPALIAGRKPELNISVSRYICPSVIDITLVGIYAETSPA